MLDAESSTDVATEHGRAAQPAVLAIWHDVQDDVVAEYRHWHDSEHLPERIGIDGFITGTRYGRVEPGAEQFLVVYELAHLGVLRGSAYLSALDHPSPQTSAIQPHFQNFLRGGFSVGFHAGSTSGRYVASVRRGHGGEESRPDPDVLGRALVESWPGAVRVIVLVPEADSTVYRSAEHDLRRDRSPDYDLVVFAEALQRDDTVRGMQQIERLAESELGLLPRRSAVYALETRRRRQRLDQGQPVSGAV
jgi:hypothetical protein